MVKDNQEFKVMEILNCKDNYRVFVIDAPENTGDTKLCYCDGAKPELTRIFMAYLEHTTLSETKDLSNEEPANGFVWK